MQLSGVFIDTLGHFIGSVFSNDPYYSTTFILGLDNDISGTVCQDAITAWTTPNGQHPASETFVTGKQKTAVSISCGVNDFNLEGHTAAQIYSDMLTLVGLIKASGATPIINTLMDTTHAGWEAVQTSLNTSIRNGAAANGYLVSDWGGDANLGCSGCASNLTYFRSDGVHPTPAGEAIQANYLASVLAGLGFQ